MKAMETIQDLIEEAKKRTVWWALFIFAVTYFLTHTSTSMWMNLPIAILIVCGLRVLSTEVEFSWKIRGPPRQSYLSYLEKKQLSLNDPRLSSAPPPPRWKKKINSPVVESAINDFIDKILKNFVVDLWYSEITADREAPELIHTVIMDALGEISGRVKEINIVDLLTRDIVDLIGDHLELFRRNQAAIGVDVMKTLSSEERDERLKYHLIASGELYPALVSPESEYKVLQRLVAGILSVVLRPRESQCPLVRTIAREIVTCLVFQPLLNLASPEHINEVMEIIICAFKEGILEQFVGAVQSVDSTSTKSSSFDSQGKDMTLAKIDEQKAPSSDYETYQEETIQPLPADWARRLEVATQRRTEVLAPENLENLWTKGRNYKKREYKRALEKGSLLDKVVSTKLTDVNRRPETSIGSGEKEEARLRPKLSLDNQLHDRSTNRTLATEELNKALSFEGGSLVYEDDDANEPVSNRSKSRLTRSSSMSDLKPHFDAIKAFMGVDEAPIITEFYNPDIVKHREQYRSDRNVPNILLQKDGLHLPKLRCKVLCAYFEKLDSKSFAVYCIAVTDAENRTWFVKRRYSNFERLHRHLKDIPNYNLHLPPKRIFSSNTEDAFVHQRCIQLDKYLQDILSIANVAEQHEVWDFLNASSKNYSFGKSSSVMKTLAVNVDDAMDDIVRQFKGVSDGLVRKVVSSSSSHEETFSPISSQHLSLNVDEISKHLPRQVTSESMNSTSDIEDIYKETEDRYNTEANGWHSDNELDSKGFPAGVIRPIEGHERWISEKKHDAEMKSESSGPLEFRSADYLATFDHLENPVGTPPARTPPNVSVPLLNLVDKVFQLNRRGWLRRQVFWISKQILHLVMEDAIDDWLMTQICWIRKEDTIAQVIHWIQDILWPDGIFFTRVGVDQSRPDANDPSQKPFQIFGQFGGIKSAKSGSFEQQLEASRRASEIKKFLFDGAPTALVGLIGHKQYQKCARDIFYFTQSTICVKQLAFAMVDLLLKSIFPELEDLLKDIRENTRTFDHSK